MIDIKLFFRSKYLIKRNFILLFFFLTLILFLLRLLIFTERFGGIEHDSGWYLGVARNLAERGIYAAYTNTVVSEGEGVFKSIHNRVSVQDRNGYVYFPAGVTVGPLYVVPEALMIKLFGNGFWQYRLWPIIGFIFFLIVLFFILYRLGGIVALIIFQLWLWLMPQIIINYVYEAYSENIALLFLLSSFLFYFWGFSKKRLFYLWSGIFFSLSILSKIIFIINGLVFVPIFLYEIWICRKEFKEVFLRCLSFSIGFLLPIVFYEGYRYIYLINRFGIEAWQAVNEDLFLTFQNGGSGVFSSLTNSCDLDIKFLMSKISLWTDIGLSNPLLAWFAYIVIGISLFLNDKKNKVIIYLLFGSSLISFIWFIFISPNGWGRHIFQGFLMSMILFSVGVVKFYRFKDKYFMGKVFSILVISLLLIPVIFSDKTTSAFLLKEEDINRWYQYRNERGVQGFPFVYLMPIREQKELVEFFKDNIKNEQIYYHSTFLVSEIAPLVDKVFFPLERYLNSKEKKVGYLIFGPYQQGRFNILSSSYLHEQYDTYCKEIVYQSPSYSMCRLK